MQKEEREQRNRVYPQKNEVVVAFDKLILNEDDKRNFEEVFVWINNVVVNKNFLSLKLHPMENMGNYSSFYKILNAVLKSATSNALWKSDKEVIF